MSLFATNKKDDPTDKEEEEDKDDNDNEEDVTTDEEDANEVDANAKSNEEDSDEEDADKLDDDEVKNEVEEEEYEEDKVKNVEKKQIDDEYEEDKDEDEDDGDAEVSDYLQKFTREKNKNYIKDFHPEMSSHNYEEVKLLSIITRDKNGIIIDSLHKTIPILTKFEKTRILGQRAKQIDSGARPFVDVPKDIIEGYLIAKKELAEKKIPFIIKRPLPNGGCEYWNVNDLEDL